MSDRPSLAVVIVTYNSRAEIGACLRSIAVESASPTEICIVDNGSSDGTPQALRSEWPQVRMIEPSENLGFARANNVGIRATESELVLFLNPDTIVGPEAIATLVDRLVTDPGAAAAGPRLVDPTGAAELSFGWTLGPLGELRQKVLLALYQKQFGPVVERIERWTREAGPREWLSGACLLARRRDVIAAGLFDERFFMYTEDVDLCVSLRALGKTILFVPEAQVTHLRGRSAGRNPRTEQLRRQSQLAYYAKHHPGWLPVLKLYLRIRRSRDVAMW